MDDAELRALHPPRRCESSKEVCGRGPIDPEPAELDQSQGKLPAVEFACLCGWRQVKPLKPNVVMRT